MPLSTRELNYVKDHLSLELLMAKKYNEYARQMKDTQLKQIVEEIGKKHQNNFNTLLSYLT